MAAIDFPASPTNGQVFVASNGVTYRYATTPGIWAVASVTDFVFSGVTPPTSPILNQLWWHSEIGVLFIYYNDGNTTQWVPASPSGPVQQGFRLLSRQVLSAAAPDVNFQNVPSDINSLAFEFDMTPVNNGQDLCLQFYDAAGVLDSTIGHYASVQTFSYHTQNASTPAGMGSAAAAVSNSVLLTYSVGTRRVGNVNGVRGKGQVPAIRAARLQGVDSQCNYVTDDAAIFAACTGSGYRNFGSGPITGLRLVFGSGNVAAGSSFAVWGSP